jgi:ankyrin repeat protein
VALLLERGADPNLPEEGIAPQGHALHSAVCSGHHDIVALLLEHGARPNVEVESSADTLSAALTRGDARMVDLLCSYGAARRLHLHAYYDDVRTAAAMLAADPHLADDPEAHDNANSESFVRLLLRLRPDLPRRVSTAKSRALTERLFRHGMDPSRRDRLRITPLHRFAGSGDIENAALFLDHGPDIDACDEELRTTPLGYAARSGKRRMVEFLLRRGARADLPAEPAWARPVAWARRRGHDAIVQVLERFGEDGAAPPEPGVEDYRRLAEDVVSACAGGDADAVARLVAWFDLDARAWQTGNSAAQAVRRFVGEKLHPERSNGAGHEPDLDDAKWLIARANGFADWDALTRHAAADA